VAAFDSVDFLPITLGAEGGEHGADTGAPRTTVGVPLIAPTRLGCQYLSAEARYRAACLRFGRIAPAQRGYKHGERRIHAALRLMERRADRILARTPTTIADVVDRAIVARSSMTETPDGRWFELAGEPSDAKAVAELVLAVLTLAGLTDGTVERLGRSARPQS